MSDQSKLEAVRGALDDAAPHAAVGAVDAAFLIGALERRGYQILPFPPDHPWNPDKQRRRDAGLSTSDRPTNVTRVGLRPATMWVPIGDHDGYLRGVVEAYADDKAEYVASCSHRHASRSRAMICADRMVRVRARRAERLANAALNRGG